jgi:hypothetical protein
LTVGCVCRAACREDTAWQPVATFHLLPSIQSETTMIARCRPVGQRLPVCRMPGLGPRVVSESQALAAPCLSRDSISKILDAAEELFAQFGSEAVSVSDVAKLAGVSKSNKSNIFHYFNSKHDLYIAVLDRARRAFYSLIEQLGSGHGDVSRRLRQYAAGILTPCWRMTAPRVSCCAICWSMRRNPTAASRRKCSAAISPVSLPLSGTARSTEVCAKSSILRWRRQ